MYHIIWTILTKTGTNQNYISLYASIKCIACAMVLIDVHIWWLLKYAHKSTTPIEGFYIVPLQKYHSKRFKVFISKENQYWLHVYIPNLVWYQIRKTLVRYFVTFLCFISKANMYSTFALKPCLISKKERPWCAATWLSLIHCLVLSWLRY